MLEASRSAMHKAVVFIVTVAASALAEGTTSSTSTARPQGSPETSVRNATAKPTASSAGVPAATTRTTAGIFYSGHSLTDNPLPEYVAEIARSLGGSVRWNQQNIPGSSIQARTRGPATDGAWSGYRRGKNRDGENLDVLRELRQPATLGGARYDTLVVTEGHWLVESLLHADTVRSLRHLHDRLIEGNPDARTLFYAPWLGIGDKSAPQDWIAYEKAAAPVWTCVTTRINQSLADEGRRDRVQPMPTASALAALVERAVQQPGVPGISGATARGTMDRLFIDQVHLSRLGAYYAALVTYIHVFGRSPQGAWAPVEVTAEQAKSLQQVAWDVAAPQLREAPGASMDLPGCRAYVQDTFCSTYYGYFRRAYWSDPKSPYHRGTVSGRLKEWKETLSCRSAFGRDKHGNPFFQNREHDRSYWHAAP
jgi:hypothetical protein